MKALVESMGVFEGQPGEMLFSLRLDLLRQRAYFRAGQFVRWSVQQGGPGIPVLHKLVYILLCTPTRLPQDVEGDLNRLVDSIQDEQPKKILLEVLVVSPLE